MLLNLLAVEEVVLAKKLSPAYKHILVREVDFVIVQIIKQSKVDMNIHEVIADKIRFKQSLKSFEEIDAVLNVVFSVVRMKLLLWHKKQFEKG